MTDTKPLPLYVVCWTHRESPAKSYRFEKAFPRQEAEILAYEENQRFPSFMHWVELAPVEEPAAAPDPRDALIAQMREALEAHVEAHGKSRLAAAGLYETLGDADRAHDMAMILTHAALAKTGEPT